MEDSEIKLEPILLSEDAIMQRVVELAAKISHDYPTAKNLRFVGIMNLAFIFMADLARALTMPHTVDFMAVSNYGRKGAVSGERRLILDLREPIEGAELLVLWIQERCSITCCRYWAVEDRSRCTAAHSWRSGANSANLQ